MDLKYVRNLCEQKLSKDVKNKIDVALNEYLKESSQENIANVIGSTFQKVKKDFRCKNFTADNESDFWEEVTQFWHLAETSYFGINGKMRFDFEAAKRGVYPYIESLGGVMEASRIAQFESLGGMPAIIDAIHKRMEEKATEHFIAHLIDKNFNEYRRDFNVVQYIAVQYLEAYRPDLHESRHKNFQFCVYDNRGTPYNQFKVPGLNTILRLHIKERQI